MFWQNSYLLPDKTHIPFSIPSDVVSVNWGEQLIFIFEIVREWIIYVFMHHVFEKLILPTADKGNQFSLQKGSVSETALFSLAVILGELFYKQVKDLCASSLPAYWPQFAISIIIMKKPINCSIFHLIFPEKQGLCFLETWSVVPRELHRSMVHTLYI